MNKLIIGRAQQFARRLIACRHTVRNWTHEDAQRYLEEAYVAGARSLDRWHLAKTRKAVNPAKYYECGEGYAHPVGQECHGQCVNRG